MTRSYSMPKDSEYRKFRGMGNKAKPNINMSLYQDAALSSAQDYVSGCSLITHTPLKPKSLTSNRTKGRASEHKLRFWSSNRSAKTTQDPGLSVDQSNFIRSSSFHGRSSKDERMNNLPTSRSFDTGSKPNNLSLAKSDSRLKALSDPPDLVGSKSNVENLRLSADDISSKIRSHSLATNGKSASSSTLSDATIDGDKTIRRLPDIIHESVTWNDISHQPDQPLYFSPATEPMTPLGNRHFKFGFGFTDQEIGFEFEDSRRGMVKPPYPQSGLVFSNNSNTANNQITIQISDTHHPAIPISYNTWSSKSSDSDSLNRSGNFTSSLQEINASDMNATQRSNEIMMRGEQSPMQNAPISMNYMNEEDSINNENQCKPHSDSILSGYSSICSDQERGSLCSLETCSCTSSEDPESSSHHYHRTGSTKPRRRIQPRNGSFYDDRPK